MTTEGFAANVRDKSNLDLQDIIEILSSMNIIFKCGLLDLGEDTNFECIEFELPKPYYSFDYYLDLDTHGHTINGGINDWFYSPKSRKEFVHFIRKGHIDE